MMSPSGFHVNKPVIFLIIGVIGAVIFWFNYTPSTEEKVVVSKDDKKDKLPGVSSDIMEFSNELFDTLKTEQVPEEKTLKVKDGLELVYREVLPTASKFDVLFLHGQAYEAKTWVSDPVYTLQMLNKVGYRAVALDLPEAKGKSKMPGDMENREFIKEAIAALKLDKPVIVSPSMSGGYSLPYLFSDPATVLERSRGFVPVAPVSTAEYKDKFKDAKIPTLIIYGENDKSIGPESVKNLKNLSNIKMEVTLKSAGHACYINQPKDFSIKLVEFLKLLK